MDLINDEMRTMEPEQFEALIANQRKFFKITDGMGAYLNANAWLHSSKRKETKNMPKADNRPTN